MSLRSYAESELKRLGKDEDGLQDQINQDILQLLEVFENQGHSGFSAGYALSLIDRLIRFKPITPLTGEESEWNEVGPRGVRQNKRCSSVFQEEDGTFEDIDAIIVSDNGGITWFSSGRFRKKIEFPYLPSIYPEKVYIEPLDNPPIGFSSEDYEIITDKPERIKALHDKKIKEFENARR